MKLLTADMVAIGEILIDFIPVTSDTYSDVPAFEKHFGGAPFNYAVAAARLGAEVGALAAVGTDPFGQFLIDTLNKNNVDTRHVKIKKQRTTLAFVVSEPNGEKSFFFYRKPWFETADTMLSPSDVDPAYLRSAKILHYSGVALTHSPERDAVFKAIENTHASGGLISYDPNIRLELWSSNDELRAMNDIAMRKADIILLAKDEAEFLFGKCAPKKIVAKIKDKYHPRYVALKLGDQGSHVEDEAGTSFFKPAYEVKVVDTTGAGDGWDAAFDYGLIQGWDLETCITVANAVGALTVTKRGATSAMPTIAELNEFLRKRGIALQQLKPSGQRLLTNCKSDKAPKCKNESDKDS
jgi:sugar/nucleoside kinase (ribokinase family)